MPLFARDSPEYVRQKFCRAQHPKGIKFVRQSAKGNRIYVLEANPFLLRAKYMSSARDERHLRVFRVRVPWSYLVMHISRAGVVRRAAVFFTRNQAKDPSEEAFMAPFPNVTQEGFLCLVHHKGLTEIAKDEEAFEAARSILKHFYRESFNTDHWAGPRLIPEGFRQAKGKNYHCFFEDWERFTQEGREIKWRHFYLNKRTAPITNLNEAMDMALYSKGGE
jgi:hypothetical protein